jgi:MFS family permease
MADYGGRKWTIFVGCTIVVIAGIVQCLSINIHMFTAARFLSTLNHLRHRHSSTDMGSVGMGSGFSGLGSPLLITELAHPAERGKITALYKYVTLSIVNQDCRHANIVKHSILLWRFSRRLYVIYLDHGWELLSNYDA